MHVHLISMPWAAWNIPSIQIGALKSFLDTHLTDADQIFDHHLHLSITARTFSYEEYVKDVLKFKHEGNFFFLVMKRFSHHLPRAVDPAEIKRDIERHAVKHRIEFRMLSDEKLQALMEATDKDLEERIVKPSQNAQKIVVGMTTNFYQTYANLYVYYYLRERLPGKEIVFVLGGASVSYPHVLATLSHLKIDAYAVIGEGEQKLLKFVKRVASGEPLEDKVDGIFHVASAPETLDWNESWFKSQISSMDQLPEPNFDQYFKCLDEDLVGHPDWARLRMTSEIPIEGSRGCAFACEFCNLNRFWAGYRKLPGEVIAERTLTVTQKYKVKKVRFVDNLCDSWALSYAQRMINANKAIPSMMEMRPKHSYDFWKTLKKAGLEECQIGVEGLDEDVLKRVNKGTNVFDIIFNQRSLTENLIAYGSRQLITYYPRSTVEEVQNTRRVLEALLHMPKFDMGGFVLGIDSPIYRTIPKEDRRELVVSKNFATSMPDELKEYNVFFPLVSPPSLFPTAEAQQEWSKLTKWYNAIPPGNWIQRYLLAEEKEDECIIRDHRDETNLMEYTLSGLEHKVHQLCREPQEMATVISKAGGNIAEAMKALKSLEERRLVFGVNGRYISLAIHLSLSELQSMTKRGFAGVIR